MVEAPRFSIWAVDLNPVKGSEQAGYRPVLVVSPEVMNTRLKTVIAAPMTTALRGWPTRVSIEHGGKQGEIALDQLRTLDKTRLVKPLGLLDSRYHKAVFNGLQAIFAE